MYQTTHAVNGERKMPDPEVSTKAKRRTFTAEYKRRILEEADGCTGRGEMGALLRREGLYSSHLTTWRRQREAGELAGLTPKKRGRKQDKEAAELAKLRARMSVCASNWTRQSSSSPPKKSWRGSWRR